MASPEPTHVGRRGNAEALRALGLGYSYGARRALNGVDLFAERGEVVGILGPNGCGKSTLVKVLSGVLEGYEGSVEVDGREVQTFSRRDLARRIAVVPQETTFGFSFTALEVVLMGRHPHVAGLRFESARDVAIAREALDRCGAADLESRTIHALSSGERQRVVFARALAQEPKILLLDEPASFLDIRHQVGIFDIVRSLAEEHRCSVLAVLHDLNLAAEYCDRVYLMREGQVQASGPTAETFTYANLTDVFRTEIYVDTNSLTGKLVVAPLPASARRAVERMKPADE